MQSEKRDSILIFKNVDVIFLKTRSLFLNIYKIRTGPGQTSPDCPDGLDFTLVAPIRTVSGQ